MKGNPTLKSRRQRRQEARANGTPFEPIYNGFLPRNITDYSKFDGKYVTVTDKLSEETLKGDE